MSDPRTNQDIPDKEALPDDHDAGSKDPDHSADYPKRDRPLNDGDEAIEQEDIG